MNRISSRSTFVTKRVFPILWFGFVGVFFVSSSVASLSGGAVPVQFLIFPLVMAGFGYFLMKNLVLDLVDEVWDAGSDKEITFAAPAMWIPFAKSPIVEKLIERIDAARGIGS